LSDGASHIFICFSSKDSTIARDVVAYLEGKGLRCWISLRDVPPGENYQETLDQALETARGVVFLFSEFSKDSSEIKKELSIGASIRMPVFPLRLSPITPSGALRYELATRQWIDIFPDRDVALARLADAIRRVLDAPPGAGGEPEGFGLGLAAGTAVDPAGRTGPAPREPILAAGSSEFEAVRGLLARHVGPIAKILVQKAATQARTPSDFCDQLAAHVSAPAERTAFLREVRAKLAVKS
jgi:hypothetical protein